MNIPEKNSSGNYAAVHLNAIIDCLHDIEARLPKPEAPKRWRAGEGEEYWYLSDSGTCLWSKDYYAMTCDYRYKIGNYFATKNDVINYREQLLTNGAQV